MRALVCGTLLFGSYDDAVCMPLLDLERLTSTSADSFGYSYGAPNRALPRRIVLVRHGESYGNVDESEYTRTPDSQIRLTRKGHEQARRGPPGPRGRHSFSISNHFKQFYPQSKHHEKFSKA